MPGSNLLERESALALLTGTFDAVVSSGGGCNLLVVGEAGVGKTTLVRAFAALPAAARAQFLWSANEALFHPRPLGALADLAPMLPLELAARINAGHNYSGLFPAFLAYLRQSARPTVLVIEDAHWADEATLDFIKYLGRRIDSARALLVVTLRDDELGLDHPLRSVLGDLPPAATRRVQLQPLSPQAVAAMARQHGREGDALYGLTSGNPFFVGEVLASPEGAVPASVRDALLARVARLGPAARQVIELVAVEPGWLEHAVVEALVPGVVEGVAEACAAAVLRAQPGALAFRHEIARRGVESALPPERRAQLHAALLQHLARRRPSAAAASRLVHHAIGAGLPDQVRLWAPQAAGHAAALGSHRDAAALYRQALQADDGQDAPARAGLLEAAATELQMTGALKDSIDLREQALALRRAAGDRLHEGINLRLLGTAHQRLQGASPTGRELILAAVDALEAAGPSPELARAYASRSDIHRHDSEFEAAREWAQRAHGLARRLGDRPAELWAVSRRCRARLAVADDARALDELQQALAQALQLQLDDLAGELFLDLQLSAGTHHDYARVLAVGRQAVAYCEDRDLDGRALHARLLNAYALVNLGRAEEGEREMVACATAPKAAPATRSIAVIGLRMQHVRRGFRPLASAGFAGMDGDVDDYWRAMDEHVRDPRAGFRGASMAGVCTEAAWLRGDLDAAVTLARIGLQQAQATRDGWAAGGLQAWLARLGAPVPLEGGTPMTAYALEMQGDVAGAAAWWQHRRFPYAQALVLAFGDELQMRDAVALFERLGAARAAEATRRRLRALGAKAVPRGPQPRTRGDPLGLTARERQVFELLRQGLSNAAIATRLHRSPRTVENHVAALLAKLGANSRVQLLARHPLAVLPTDAAAGGPGSDGAQQK